MTAPSTSAAPAAAATGPANNRNSTSTAHSLATSPGSPAAALAVLELRIRAGAVDGQHVRLDVGSFLFDVSLSDVAGHRSIEMFVGAEHIV